MQGESEFFDFKALTGFYGYSGDFIYQLGLVVIEDTEKQDDVYYNIGTG